jgi:hypothetical protein
MLKDSHSEPVHHRSHGDSAGEVLGDGADEPLECIGLLVLSVACCLGSCPTFAFHLCSVIEHPHQHRSRFVAAGVLHVCCHAYESLLSYNLACCSCAAPKCYHVSVRYFSAAIKVHARLICSHIPMHRCGNIEQHDEDLWQGGLSCVATLTHVIGEQHWQCPVCRHIL